MMRLKAMRRERTAAQCIPYAAQLNQHVVRTLLGDYLQVFRLGGASFESADDAQLNNWHARLNVLWRNLASPHVVLWVHVVRRRDCGPPQLTRGTGFADSLYAKYCARLCCETLMVNELYLSVIYRPTVGVATNLAAGLLRRTDSDAERAHSVESMEACEKLAQTIEAALVRYEPTRLGAYRRGSLWHSSILEFLGGLINGEQQSVPLPSSPLASTLATSRLLFGSEAMEYRTATETRLSAMLGIKEYPAGSVVGMFDRLLSAPFEFVLTQSFAFLSKAASEGLLQRQIHRMRNAGDFGVSQTAQLQIALDALSSNEFVIGDHHCTLQVLAEGDAGDESGVERLRKLNESLALARSLLSETGMTVAREDLALEAGFWSQLPGNFALRPRKAPITSRNFAAMSAFHNFPSGRSTGNHWGDALAVLITSARSPYHFSLHASDPRDPDGGSRRDTGHTFICGPTGSGKTVFIGFLVAMLARAGATQVVFDKDHGLEILIRALDGEYLDLRSGVHTGFNPLQLPESPGNLEFLKTWLACLARSTGGGSLSVAQQNDLDQALHGTLALELRARRLSRLIEFLDATDPEGLHPRLARWCASGGGDYAWAFDCERDLIVERLSGRATIGFDVTEFLEHPGVRAPITMYLFHLVRQMLDGRRLVCWMDEFWRLLADPAFENFAQEGPKTWRKLNAVMCLATQSASDVLNSPISRTIVEQTPTKILFPNGDADAVEYTQGFGLTEREFSLVKEKLEPGSRRFLVKQGQHSVVCQLDLKGFDSELRVISGRAGEIARMHRLIDCLGSSPDQWLAEFQSSAEQSSTGVV